MVTTVAYVIFSVTSLVYHDTVQNHGGLTLQSASQLGAGVVTGVVAGEVPFGGAAARISHCS